MRKCVYTWQMCGCILTALGAYTAVPHVMKQVRADKGAIPFVLSGANVMCPGLTSAGGEMPEDLPAGTPVAIMAEGKEHAMAIGVLTLSTDDMYVLVCWSAAALRPSETLTDWSSRTRAAAR